MSAHAYVAMRRSLADAARVRPQTAVIGQTERVMKQRQRGFIDHTFNWAGAIGEVWAKASRRETDAQAPSAVRQPLNMQLALQGGGAHGAFTWGVLDRLLEERWLGFEGISGSSAGAMNAVVMASGWLAGGREGAREALDRLWGEVGEQMPRLMTEVAGMELGGASAMMSWLKQWTSQLTPSQLNPLGLDPLGEIVRAQIDFEGLREASPFQLYIAATHVRSGRLRLFRERELTADHVLASACLPTLHHTVMIDGEAYWDGGFSANPALFPLIKANAPRDLLMVLLTPPTPELSLDTRQDIDQHVAGLAFSTHLLRELEMIRMLRRRAKAALWPTRQERMLRELRLHWIDISSVDMLRSQETKLWACTPFLEELKGLGRAHAEYWLMQHRDDLGHRPTFDLDVYH